MLNPLTQPVLERIPRAGVRRILDIGCGQGHTTRFLAGLFPEAEIIGLEYDSSLVGYAASQAGNSPRIRFEQGDASQLSFPNGSFDLVFCRYLLLHIPDVDAAIREMLRVCSASGHVVAYEPDCALDVCYPEHPALGTVTVLFGKLFPHPWMGRQVLYRFRAQGARIVDGGGVWGVDYQSNKYRRLYRLTAEALGAAALAKGLMSEEEYARFLADMRVFEASEETVVFKLPDAWVIAQKPTSE